MILLLITVALPTGVNMSMQQTSIDKVIPRVEQSQGITVNKLKADYVSKEKAEEILENQLIDVKETAGYKLITLTDEIYLYIGLGEKPTGGYDLEVTYMEDNEGILNMEVKVIEPKAGDMVSQVINYPSRILKLNFAPIKVNMKSNMKEMSFKEIK
jgi:hypothetical protein